MNKTSRTSVDIDPETLASEFEKLAEDIAAQASAVDFVQAMAAGHRCVRRRRALAGACAVTGFGLAALVAMPALTGGPTPVPVTSAATVAEAPSDPLTTRAEFGWLPTPLSATSHTSDPLNGIGTLNGHPVGRYVATEHGGLTGNAVNGGIQAPAKCETYDTPGLSLAQAGITAFGQVSVVWRTPSGDWAYATREINGLDYTVYIYRDTDGPTASLTAFGTATQILDHLTSFGPDPANWTTHVIQH